MRHGKARETDKIYDKVTRSLGITLGTGLSSIPTNSPVIFKRQRYKKPVSDTLPAVMFVLALFLEANLFTPRKNGVFI